MGKKVTIYSWAVETLSDCKNGLDAVNLHELIVDLRNDGEAIIAKVIEELTKERDRQVELHDLCPECFQDSLQASPPWNPENPSARRCYMCGEEEE